MQDHKTASSEEIEKHVKNSIKKMTLLIGLLIVLMALVLIYIVFISQK